MTAKLINYSQVPVDPDIEYPDKKSLLELIAFCARVSNPANQSNPKTAEKLVKYLIKHKHWSPLEMVSACVEIETTRDIARQILRHRSFSFQEFSQRYADPTEDLDFTLREARLQDTSNRQNSIDIDELSGPEGQQLQKDWQAIQYQVIHEAKMAYRWAIENGIAKEQARAVLPEGNTISRMYVNGTLRSWVHYIELRSSNGTQKEHIQIARECAAEIAKVFPMIRELAGEEYV